MNELYIGLLRASSPLVMVLDRDGRILLWNHACSILSGYSFDEVRNREAWALLAPRENADETKKAFHRVLRGESPPRVDGYMVTKSGERRWIGWSHEVTTGEDGSVELVVVIGTDRTDAKQAEDALRVSEAKFAGIVGVAADAIISIDEKQNIVIYNEGAERTFGWRADEVLGRSVDVLIPARFRKEHHKHVEKFAEESQKARRAHRPEILGLRKNGEEFPCDAAISKVHVDGVRLYTVVLRDITEQRRRERDQQFLADLGAALGTSLDYAETVGMVAELSVQYFADCCIIDVREDDSDVRPYRRWKVVHADPTKAALAKALEQVKFDRKRPYVAGSALETRTPVLVTDVTEEHLRQFAQNEDHERLLRELAPTSYIAVPLVAHGDQLGAMILVRTATKRGYDAADIRVAEALAYRAAHSIESAKLYRRARRATEARDDILRVVAHDLRNPLNAAALAAELLLRGEPGVDDPVALRQNIGTTVIRSIARANRLIEDLMDVSRIRAGQLPMEPAPTSSQELIEEVLDTFGPMATAARISLLADAENGLPPVFADRVRIFQVFSNLVGNAIKFTPGGGSIRVGGCRKGDYVRFWVADTGRGISQEDLPRVFEQFWQARRGDRSSAGLGLSIAKGIVQAHRGSIWVESTLGAGSTFSFTIPCAVVERDESVESFRAPRAAAHTTS
ncbi:MAG: PAS domain S-box protein [Polyangiaceae bacterium]|nr:PAS domain S-box protein [Polyangiaceae bacterium]